MSRSHANGRSPARIARWTLAWGVGAAPLLTMAGSARADCAVPAPSVVWSSPAAGAVDVPVDADLLLLTERIDLASAEPTLFVGGLLELPLEAGSTLPGHFDLPELEPNQAHTIVLHPEQGGPITIGFTTGERRASSAGGAVGLISISQEPYAPGLIEEGLCHDVLFRDTCFDTGIPLLQTLQVEASAVDEHSLWAIETVRFDFEETYIQFWPAVCGPPRQWGALPSDAQYRLYNIGESGAIRESDVLAQAFDLPPPPPRSEFQPAQADTDPSRGISCSLPADRGRSAPSLAAACALALMAAWRRRTRRYDGDRASASPTAAPAGKIPPPCPNPDTPPDTMNVISSPLDTASGWIASRGTITRLPAKL
jgi:hypothetical protein